MTVPVSWFGIEVSNNGNALAFVSWFGIEGSRSVADKASQRSFPPRRIWAADPEVDAWVSWNRQRRGGAPRPKRPVQYTIT